MTNVTINVNGVSKTADIADNVLLVEFLRGEASLTGTHVGCDTSQCGACVVHVNGASVKSCTMLAVEADGAEVATIEGMANEDGSLGILQKAFQEHHGLQCGYCTPGMVMSAADLLKTNKNPTDHEVREWLEGNICRCTGYHNIVKAIQSAAAEMRG
jgi:Aerobic-type carbon monoxide dehydrogenase, small subunit CoxS/CutS homologs